MAKTHIDITIDFTTDQVGSTYDLSIPIRLSVKQLLMDVSQTLKLRRPDESRNVIKVTTKQLVLADDDMLSDYPVTDGDILKVL